MTDRQSPQSHANFWRQQMLDSVATKSVRRPPNVEWGTVEEVAAGLRRYAGRAEAAVRPVELARRLGLGRRIVQLALESLVAAPASGVRSRQRAGEVWEKYWASAQT